MIKSCPNVKNPRKNYYQEEMKNIINELAEVESKIFQSLKNKIVIDLSKTIFFMSTKLIILSLTLYSNRSVTRICNIQDNIYQKRLFIYCGNMAATRKKFYNIIGIKKALISLLWR